MNSESVPGFGDSVFTPIPKKPEFPPNETRTEASMKNILKSAAQERRDAEKAKLHKKEKPEDVAESLGFLGIPTFLLSLKDQIFASLKILASNQETILRAIREPKELEIKKLKDQILEERTIAVSHAAEADELRNKLEKANSILKKVAETSILLNAENAFKLYIRALPSQEVNLKPLEDDIVEIHNEIQKIFKS